MLLLRQRQRLYGLSFPLDHLAVTETSAHNLLNEAMDFLCGVEPCHPAEYLFDENADAIRAERSLQHVRSLNHEDFLSYDDGEGHDIPPASFRIDTLFKTQGALPSAVTGPKRRRLKANSSDAASPTTRGTKWVEIHKQAFKQQGLDSCDLLQQCFGEIW